MPQDPTYVKDVRYMTEQEEARERLKNSVDALTKQASLHVQMEKEPVKMLGGASAVGAVVGLIIGRQFRKTKRVYVDAASPIKHQKALVKAQAKQSNNPGGAIAATLVTFAFKTVMDRVISPKLEEVASGLLEKAGQPQAKAASKPVSPTSTLSSGTAPVPSYAAQAPAATAQRAPAQSPASAQGGASSTFTATEAPASGVTSFVKPTHKGVVPIPESHVEAKAVGTPIDEEHMSNPNAR